MRLASLRSASHVCDCGYKCGGEAGKTVGQKSVSRAGVGEQGLVDVQTPRFWSRASEMTLKGRSAPPGRWHGHGGARAGSTPPHTTAPLILASDPCPCHLLRSPEQGGRLNIRRCGEWQEGVPDTLKAA